MYCSYRDKKDGGGGGGGGGASKDSDSDDDSDDEDTKKMKGQLQGTYIAALLHYSPYSLAVLL